MLQPEQSLFLIMRDRAGHSVNLPNIPGSLGRDDFNEHMIDLKKEYPSSDEYGYYHPRPKFLFPLRNSEDGNPINYFAIAIKILKSANFKQEAVELQQFMFTPYENHLKYITRYLDVGNFITYEDYKEQDDFAQKRNLSLDITPVIFERYEEKLEQVPEFTNVSISKIKQLISKEFDFNTVNIFGRNMLWYADSPETTSFLINNTDIDIFHIDEVGTNVFNKCFLHTDIECSFGTLLTIIDNMQKKDIVSTAYFVERTKVLESIVENFVQSFDKHIVNVHNSDFHKENESLKQFEMFPELSSLLNQFDKPNFDKLSSAVSEAQQKIKETPHMNMAKLEFLTELYDILLEDHMPVNDKPNIKNLKF